MSQKMKAFIDKYHTPSAIGYGVIVGAAFSYVFFPTLYSGLGITKSCLSFQDSSLDCGSSFSVVPMVVAFILMFVVVDGLRFQARRYWRTPQIVMKAMGFTFLTVLIFDIATSIYRFF